MKKITPFLMLTALAASCSIYHPQAVDIPLIEQPNETRIDASAGLSFWLLPDAVSLNLTASHGFNNWLSGQVHANYGGKDNYYLQAAPGAYLHVGEKGILEGYIGMGYGGAGYSSQNDTSASYYTYKGNFLLPFAQVNFGWRHLGPFEIGFGLKSGVLQPKYEYHRFKTDGTEDPDRFRSYNTANLLLEPQLQMRLGGEHVMFTLRLGYAWLSNMLNENSESNNFTYDFFTLSSGLNFRF